MTGFLSINKVPIFFLFLAAGLVFLSFNFNIKRQHAILHSDAEGYYMYLPALFIYHGFKDLPVQTTKQFPRNDKTGRVVTRYTYGVALLELPFFFGAHLFSKIAGGAADGYSPVYASGVMMSGIFYAWLGLLILFRELRKQFDLLIAVSTLICLFFGTNLYYYSIAAPGMSHVYSFFLFALTISLTGMFYHKPSAQRALAIGLVAGLAVLIRPTNMLIGIFILGYGIHNMRSLRNRLNLLKGHFLKIILMALPGILLLLPQMVYWKHISGSWLYYSYGNQTFSNWNQPKIFNVLFDVQNGWLIYSPMAVLALSGLVLASRQKKISAPAIWIVLALSTYAFASWWSWCFCAAFGARSYVELYALLTLPLGFFINKISGLTIFWRAPVVLLLCILIFYNLKLSYLYNGLWEGPEWTWQSLRDVLLPVFKF